MIYNIFMFGFVCFIKFRSGNHHPLFGLTCPAIRKVFSIKHSDMCRNGSPIELDEDAIFIESEWIGQTKKYADVPAFVRWKKEKDMEIPLDILQCISKTRGIFCSLL
jgi:hypothetical protein